MKTEQELHHGGKRQNRLLTKLKRLLRPKHHKIAGSGIPFDWTAGYSVDCRIKDQGQSDSCGGQAGSRWIEIALASPEISAKSVYSQGYASGGGMSKASLENVICNRQLALESDVSSYDAYRNPISETMMRDYSWIMIAKKMALLGYIPVTVNIDQESIAQAGRDTGSVIILIEGQNGNPESWTGLTPQPPLKSNPSAIWAHWLCLTGFKASYPKPLRADQSWGLEIGDKGRQYFGSDYLASGYITDAFTFVPAGQAYDPSNGLIQRLLALLQQKLQLYIN